MTPQEVSSSVTDPPAQGQTTRGTRRYPAAFASLFPPDQRRRRWGISYRCPHCSNYHYGLSWGPHVGGIRTARCGRKIWLVVARTYRAGGAE
jgi:hypothetical protein